MNVSERARARLAKVRAMQMTDPECEAVLYTFGDVSDEFAKGFRKGWVECKRHMTTGNDVEVMDSDPSMVDVPVGDNPVGE